MMPVWKIVPSGRNLGTKPPEEPDCSRQRRNGGLLNACSEPRSLYSDLLCYMLLYLHTLIYCVCIVKLLYLHICTRTYLPLLHEQALKLFLFLMCCMKYICHTKITVKMKYLFRLS